MTRAKPTEVAIRLPHPALPQADWADCYQLDVPDRRLSAIEATKLALGHFPLWVRLLMTMRNIVVAPFGVKSTADHSPDTIEMVGLFPVLVKSEHQVVLGFDDRHLDFRIVVDVADDGGGQRIRVSTLVKRKILFGKLYLAAIMPFHRLIVAAMLSRVSRQLNVSQRG